jgi:sortase A
MTLFNTPLPRAPRRSSVRHLVAWVLAAAGVVVIGWGGWVQYRAYAFDRDGREALSRVPEDIRLAPRASAIEARVEPHGLVGILDIPRLGLSEVVAEGDDASTLRMAIGHLPDTPLPWQMGNAAIAGHRNTHFEPLKDIRPGDRMTLATPHGDFIYAVQSTAIVLPSDISVLAPTPDRTLTLITCYPFIYVGHAPKRFVIRASAVADSDRPD